MKDVRFVNFSFDKTAECSSYADQKLREPLLWLSEFRKKDVILFYGDDSINMARRLNNCLSDGSKVISIFRADMLSDAVSGPEHASPPQLPRDEDASTFDDAFCRRFVEFNREKQPDIIVIGLSVLTYRLLHEVRRALGRLGVIIASAQQREMFLEKFSIIEKFCRDVKIDYVMLSEQDCAIFVWSWNVKLVFPEVSSVASPIRQSLALASVVKNESRFIASMIGSVIKLVEFAAILDTGSTDDTIAIASRVLGDEGVACALHTAEFNGFAEARNRSIIMVPPHISWILMLDADEIIREADFERLSELLYHPVHDAWALPRVNWESANLDRCISYPDRQFRLFRNNGRIKYEGVVHERLAGYRSLGWPAPNVSFAGLTGGPHIHHMAKTVRTKAEEQEKVRWYLSLADSPTRSVNKEPIAPIEGKTAHDIFRDATKTGRKDAQGLLLDLESNGTTLVISCSGIVPNKVIYAMENSSRDLSTKKLFLCDSKSLWYYKGIDGLTTTFDETIDLVGQLVGLLSPSRTCAIGTSGGGYMALALGARLGLDRVLALSPQTIISPAWRAENNDSRWASNMSSIHQQIAPTSPFDIRDLIQEQGVRLSEEKTHFHIVYPESDPLDVAHAVRMRDLKAVHLYGLVGSGHNVSAELKRRGKLQLVLEAFIQGSEPELGTRLMDLILK